MQRKVGQDMIVRKKIPKPQGRFSEQKKKPEQKEIPSRVIPEKEVTKKAPQPIHRKVQTQNNHQRTLRGGYLWGGVVLVTIGFIVSLLSVFAHAQIVITLKESRFPLDIQAMVYEEPLKDQLGFKFATITDTESILIPTSNLTTVGSSAEGTIRLFSTQSTALSLPEKTSITSITTGKKFLTSRSIIIPAGSVQKPSSVDVRIIAVVAGEESNIGRDDFIVDTAVNIQARSLDDIDGGSSVGRFTLSPEEVSQGKETLLAKMQNREVFSYAINQIPENFIFLDTPIQTSEITFSEQVKTTGVELTASRLITGSMIDRENLAVYLSNLVIPKDQQDFMKGIIDLSTITIIPQGELPAAAPPGNTIGQNTSLPVHITGEFVARAEIDTDVLLKKVAYEKKKDAKSTLSETPGVIRASLKMKPVWISRVPNRVSKISLDIIFENIL